MHVLLEKVRSFSKPQRIPLRPLTLLVGENSSGKSSFLAIVSCVFDDLRFPGNPGFNIPPYNLGTFETIATHRAGRNGTKNTFALGLSEGEQAGTQEHQILSTYGNDQGNVVLRTVRIATPKGRLELRVSGTKLATKIAMRTDEHQAGALIDIENLSTETPLIGSHARDLGFLHFPAVIMQKLQEGRTSKGELDKVWSFLASIKQPSQRPFSFAPIRSKPRRTYDELSEKRDPEGDHVPALLGRLLREEPESEQGRRIQRALIRFGKDSALFKKISVKRLGKKVSDPFQIQVAINGQSANLVDVGYGVSQALPIVVQSVLRTKSDILLLQQPEVHLHPRAQAALGSFFCDLVAKDDRMILVETHSDYLVDRVRQEVAQGNIAPERVQILFFHKPHLETTVYPLTIDAHGNVEGAPESYREFFLKEEMNLLSRTDA